MFRLLAALAAMRNLLHLELAIASAPVLATNTRDSSFGSSDSDPLSILPTSPTASILSDETIALNANPVLQFVLGESPERYPEPLKSVEDDLVNTLGSRSGGSSVLPISPNPSQSQSLGNTTRKEMSQISRGPDAAIWEGQASITITIVLACIAGCLIVFLFAVGIILRRKERRRREAEAQAYFQTVNNALSRGTPPNAPRSVQNQLDGGNIAGGPFELQVMPTGTTGRSWLNPVDVQTSPTPAETAANEQTGGNSAPPVYEPDRHPSSLLFQNVPWRVVGCSSW